MSDDLINSFDVIPLTPLRQIISSRMLMSKQTIPHYRVAVDIEVDALLNLRKAINEENPNQRVSLNDFTIKACATALMQMPSLNVQFVNNEIHQYHDADISVVIAVEGGLSTPVIRKANEKSVRQIASEVKDVASRAASGRLKMAEITGGSFSISNLGMYGVDQFDAIINPPQGAILAVGSAKPQAVIKDGSIAVANMMRVTLSADHRAIDGANGAQFLTVIKELLQCPENL